ncbi:molecular chaperone DnaJ [Croceicoccus estronivorus]|uniref:DnaJ domain-containing protein n=1 Tax=Croceicoccus estronivorus TaxID=1172626 RepID=UPI00082AE36C|nr:DnaJ domain-containing protein [Croceicoccus estronivorus]OCC24072.1 molecular chaperone DnaJ [Croceicoccus estronivorus]
MVKLLTILLVVSLASRLLLGRWPWQMVGIGTGLGAEERRARALLGVGKAATHSEIIDAHRRLIARVHPDKGGTNDQVHEANAARDLLLAQLLPPR